MASFFYFPQIVTVGLRGENRKVTSLGLAGMHLQKKKRASRQLRPDFAFMKFRDDIEMVGLSFQAQAMSFDMVTFNWQQIKTKLQAMKA